MLDTTYADPQYAFPSQAAALDAALRAVRSESFNPRTLFLFGTYTIGKERLFLQVLLSCLFVVCLFVVCLFGCSVRFLRERNPPAPPFLAVCPARERPALHTHTKAHN